MSSLIEKAQDILENSDFNNLPYEERKRIAKYKTEQQILTIMQIIETDEDYTTREWKNKLMRWLEHFVEFYRTEWMM